MPQPDPTRDAAPATAATPASPAAPAPSPADDALEHMLAAHEAGQHKHAELMASFAMKTHADSAVPWLVFLESLLAQGRAERVATAAPIPLKAFHNQPELLRLLGEAMLAAGQPQAAEPCLRACLRRNPTNPVALQALDRILTDAGRPDPGVQALLATHPDPADATAAWRRDAPRAWLAKNTPMTDAAACQRAIAIAPAFAEAYEALAERLAETSDTGRAIMAADRALTLNRAGTTARQIRSLLLVREGQIARSIGDARAAIALTPDSAQPYFVLAYALLNGLRDDAAAAQHARGRTVNPNHPSGQFAMKEWRDRGADADFSWYFAS
ncbi:tetratricopeptide repeat protein [Roseospira marina]|uniref:Tetratricopeptide repeat protein n=1 Tax=Roseospira marina TaxID=140057 RepID=A0A5M6I6G0_9PROT|nr:tetratricopeptide repeat protein [Roseospira marina]KAA5603831.1 tetratricopeptide repeat protein [Roseospira marina]MBB4313782.1 tetratricopeptide (TPR) repeat protein [Roseospira marina]MBB5086944.1 tetratricopeptide (TPR) repeat protein [Roseospira marina]